MGRWLECVDDVSEEIQAYLNKAYGDAMVMQLARAPFAHIPTTPAYYTSFAFLSDIWKEAMGNEDIAIDDALLARAAEKMGKMGAVYDQHFLNEPGTFSGAPKEHGQQLIPPMLVPPEKDTMKMEEGIYVTATGIPGLERLFADIQKLGMNLYSNNPKIVPGATQAPPSIITNPAIKLHFARSGWSAVWMSLFTTTPLILAPYDKHDDPEIYFNNRTLEELGIGMVYTGQSLKALFQEAEPMIKRMEKYRTALLERFKTLNGITFTAEKIVTHFLQK